MSFLTHLWAKLKTFTKKSKHSHATQTGPPVEGDLFHVYEGTYRNKFIIYVEKLNDVYNFLLLPDASNIKMSKHDFKMGLSGNIITFIENTPNNVHNICNRQFTYNENSHNRR
jgi:hypothetical protein